MAATQQNRRSSFSSSTMSSLAKRNASSSSENICNTNAYLAKKRAPLSNITNKRTMPLGNITNKRTMPLGNITNIQKKCSGSSVISSSLVPGLNKTSRVEKAARPTCADADSGLSNLVIPPKSNAEARKIDSSNTSYLLRRDDVPVSTIPSHSIPSAIDVSPSKSDGVSESMSTCDSFKSPDVEYIDNNDISYLNSVERKTFSGLNISEPVKLENVCRRDTLTEKEQAKEGKIVDIDNNLVDPQLCATFACDIYKHLRASEAKKRPATDFMDRIQKDINASMRGILIDWLVEVSEEYRLVPETLYLTVNYIDRYLSANAINRQRLQLLGVACMMIAAKYEEICAPQVEEFCYITDNTYFKDEVLDMESSVLNCLKFEMTAPTAKCFLRRFVRAAQGINEVPSMQLECMASYLTELSLLEYNMLCYAPSLVAASAIFLAKYILDPSKKPWNSTLQHYTYYQPSDLCECTKDLHRLCRDSHASSLPAVRDKYSQHKYKFVAKKYCPSFIPPEYFKD